ncbi:unnamed protein product [Rhizoctonia solani]|uniref:Uncharacterized protein n=1 Tax=Rhizoctonia solani TaxID=456999 RepID=A0A8H3GY37_9AGAM|nr:unnamed protein product [Rhizoctonia solani]
MVVGSFGLTPKQLVVLAIAEGTTQGVLVPLLVKFLTSKRTHHPWFKIYVISVNVLSLLHTALRIAEAFSALGPVPRLLPFELSSIIVTCCVAAFTQTFFIYRCWRIFNRRMIFVVPYLAGLATALVSGALIGFFSAGVIPTTSHEIEIALDIWAFSSFALDLCMTLTNHSDHDSVFLTAWHVIWASAILPLVLMALVIFDIYILPETLIPSPLAAALSEKFLLISLMISLMGSVLRCYVPAVFDNEFAPADKVMCEGNLSSPAGPLLRVLPYPKAPWDSLANLYLPQDQVFTNSRQEAFWVQQDLAVVVTQLEGNRAWKTLIKVISLLQSHRHMAQANPSNFIFLRVQNDFIH